ncbi:DNA repair ATPase [Reinekea blandensis]|uniref:AAA+ ATPase domain-containing protein n=1 Tax=Reinekea blandensis MED297 TaxID=314283 RepID=A4BJ72_9GAMM|nr:DNA repair ATPase [Reinekea blandensis]EAR07825.1 hypothetical protein MED297_05254 [Reinekea sp. MED297] [Reinekea blandensis MED297]
MSDSHDIDQAVAQGGAYEVLHNRLMEQGRALEQQTQQLNDARQAEFGSTDMEVAGRVRLRTENNSIARDLVRVGEWILLGYNVNIGLRKTTRVNDVFALFRPVERDGQFEVEEVALSGTFLSDQRFVTEFEELYAYYKQTHLIQLTVKDNKLLAAFQIGDRLSDQRVFRWSLDAQGNVTEYIDNRGERDIALPPRFDFEWTECGRDDIVEGRHPHYSVLDTLFVDCQRGDLTIKVENNTDSGLGIYSEPVEVESQTLDDCQLAYADLGQLILLRILPYREETTRYLVFNKTLERVVRIDLIGQSCVQLPEDHGIVFPGGYYLSTGDLKSFDDDTVGMRFKRVVRSPNGEDVLYVFYEPEAGKVGLFGYNLISKTMQNPLFGHGYGLFDDGRLALFYAEAEPTRVHPLQIWKTPYQSDEYVSQQPAPSTFFGRIGNAELVRGVSDLYSVVRAVRTTDVSAEHFNQLSKHCAGLFDSYFWLESDELAALTPIIRQIGETSEQVLDEFEKVTAIRQQSEQALKDAERALEKLKFDLKPDTWNSPQPFVDGLQSIREQRGHLLTLRDYRYMQTERLDALDGELAELERDLNQRTLAFLSQDNAFEPYRDDITQVQSHAKDCTTVAELAPLLETLETQSNSLDLLSELVATLEVTDPTVQTQIVESISGVYGQLNQQKAKLEQQKNSMGSSEAVAQFGARFKLLGQSVNNALGMANTPEKCDEQLARLLVQLEELESQFSDYDQFLTDIISKREEIYEAFESHKQSLQSALQRRAQNLFSAAERILSSIQRRCNSFRDVDQLNTFFASDALVQKIRGLSSELRELDDVVRADDLDARLKGLKDQAIRVLRDQADLYEGDGQVIRLGKHKFSVNTQTLDLTLLVRDGVQTLHLTGTDYYEPVNDDELDSLKPYWEQALPSETDEVYRAEYLAYQMLEDARYDREALSLDALALASTDVEDMLALVRPYAATRYREGYEKGIHDHDAAAILCQLIPTYQAADVFRFEGRVRAMAVLFWSVHQAEKAHWALEARSAASQRSLLNSHAAWKALQTTVTERLTAFADAEQLPLTPAQAAVAADYLLTELSREPLAFAISKYARELLTAFQSHLDQANALESFNQILEQTDMSIGQRWAHVERWLSAYVNQQEDPAALRPFVMEAGALLLCEPRVSLRDLEADLLMRVEPLYGQHKRLNDGGLDLVLDDFLARLQDHHTRVLPDWQRLQSVRNRLVEQYRSEFRLDQFKAKPLSSFVRNKLISDVYLPLIGDNLAKQMGTVGDSKRTDLMGLLLMISPPGYGKTTLMEYVANRLGLVFMKINCPAIGHDITSIDPGAATHSAARQELEKLNLALEMGSNVMLYLDDIQHTHPEFLQKFISLCDGTRRIEGVWQGQSKTYDMRGKKFSVVMAGNPYTESGELFQIPDMLANRADIYNLGDVLSGKDDVFALSYLENSLTSNSVLAPLATREMADLYKLVDMAQRGQVNSNELSHTYNAAELQEILAVLKHMKTIQSIVLKVNQAYIASAATADKYRTEPPFKLQGSYRNMNKMAEKISSVMTDSELVRLVDDHYQGEAQLLTQGTEENLMKLAQLRGTADERAEQRWQEILADFRRAKALGGDDADTGQKVVSQLMDMVGAIQQVGGLLQQAGQNQTASTLQSSLASLEQALGNLRFEAPPVQVVNQPVPGIDKLLSTLADTFENSLVPLAKIMDGKINIDLKNLDRMTAIQKDIRELSKQMSTEGSSRSFDAKG